MSTPNEIRIKKDRDAWRRHGWTASPNALILRSDISWDARAAFGWLSLAADDPEFEVTAESLAAAGPKGRDHAQKMVRELEQHGFLTRYRMLDAVNDVPVIVYELHPLPVDDDHNTYRPGKHRDKRPFPQVRTQKLTGQALGNELGNVDNSTPPEQTPTEASGVFAGQAPKTDWSVFGGAKPDQSGFPTTPSRKTLSLSLSPSLKQRLTNEREGAREDAPRDEGEPAEWALSLIAELDFGQHRRPSRKRAVELAGRVEQAHDDGLSGPEIRRHCRAALNEARSNAVAYLLGALAVDNLPVPSQRPNRPAAEPRAGVGDPEPAATPTASRHVVATEDRPSEVRAEIASVLSRPRVHAKRR